MRQGAPHISLTNRCAKAHPTYNFCHTTVTFMSHTCHISCEDKIMFKMKAYFVLAFCLFSATLVQASDSSKNLQQRLTAEQMHATGLDTLSAEQLALLNQLLQEQTTQAIAVAVEHNTTEVKASTPVAPMAVPVLSNEPFKSKVLGNFAAWQTGTVFTLENGQQWQVNKGNAKLPKALNDPNVYVGISLVGKWYFQFDDEYLPKAMVTRIK